MLWDESLQGNNGGRRKTGGYIKMSCGTRVWQDGDESRRIRMAKTNRDALTERSCNPDGR
jgi:hypothetical protein